MSFPQYLHFICYSCYISCYISYFIGYIDKLLLSSYTSSTLLMIGSYCI